MFKAKYCTLIFCLLLSWTLASCGSVTTASRKATEAVMEDKLTRFDLATTKEDVFVEMGEPTHLAIIEQAAENIEIYGFEYGHSWYRDQPVVIFKGDRFVGAVSNPFDLMKVLQLLNVIPKLSLQEVKDSQ